MKLESSVQQGKLKNKQNNTNELHSTCLMDSHINKKNVIG